MTHYKNLDILKKWAECNEAKTAFIAAPGMGMPPGQPPMDPSMMDPAMMGQPPMDPGMQAMANQEGMLLRVLGRRHHFIRGSLSPS